VPVPARELIDLYGKMLTIRRFEERVALEFKRETIPGVVHSYIGQEAVAVGVCANLRRDDRIVSNHRGHGHCIAKGADLNRMMAEIYGRKTGYCKGKGGSMHIADFSIGMLGANGIVAAGLPIAVGTALAAQLEGGDRVSVVFFGDGACSEGEFHESLNLASIWTLPIIFACENNHYGVNTPVRDAMAVEHVAERAAAYAMPGTVVEGNDLEAVYRATRDAVVSARSGEGPSLLEFKTYRWRAHFESNAILDLRPLEEIEAWKRKCPIAHIERRLLREGILNREDLAGLDAEVLARIEEAVRFALASPLPEPAEALEDVFSA
jgi:TPP-dependent pyruvate/acetoin dehydrogenase alpha subunit